MESSLAVKREEAQVAKFKTGVFTISATEAVQGTALSCNPCKKEYEILIGKGIAKMFLLHGKQFSPELVHYYLNAITETYNETPETFLLFFKKAANGDFGKFFGEPDIGTIREWFATFMHDEICPALERKNRTIEAGTSERNRSARGIQPVSSIFTVIRKEDDFQGDIGRDL